MSKSINEEVFIGNKKPIERGFCIIVKDYCASVVSFETVSCEYSIDTVPWYNVKIPSGEIIGLNEFCLCQSRKKLDEQCKILNRGMDKFRKNFSDHGLTALPKSDLQEHRCSCGRLLGKFAGQAEVKCSKCGKVNVIGGTLSGDY